MAKRGEEWAERDAAVNWCIATVVIALVSTFILAVLCFALSYLVGKGISQDSLAVTWKFIKRIAVDPAYLAAMWSPRSQSDRTKFIATWRSILENTENLYIWQDSVNQILVKDGRVTGVMTDMNVTFTAKCVVLTTGTFMNGLMHIGRTRLQGGRISEPASHSITEQLVELGFTAGRMKTGTPVRIDGRSIHFEEATEQRGEDDFHKFSFLDFQSRPLKQRSC